MKYVCIGWCKEGIHDKVWGILQIGEKTTKVNQYNGYQYTRNVYLTFWGRRGHKLQTNLFEGDADDAETLFRKKTKKGYKEINKDELDTVYPEFQNDLEKTAIWATLKL